MSLEMLKQQMCDIGKRIYEKGMVAANDGNLSVRIDKDVFLVTPTGVSKGFLTKDMLLLVNGKGELLEGTYRPTSEIKMHLRVYQERPDVGAVVHVHPPYATAFAVAGIPLDQATMPELIVLLGSIPLAPYGTPSTGEVPEAIAPYVHDHQGVLLENHGALTWGKDLEHAYFLMESLEFCAKINWLARQINGDRELNERHVKRLLELKEKMGIHGKAPQGIRMESDVTAKKVSPKLEVELSEQAIEEIVHRVTNRLIKAISKRKDEMNINKHD
jgi:L-fuculose-phosphate aldolase